ncbi:helix-turn-helix domain-containing protein [Streptomyces sp. NPDC094049]|uniref:helix-turn-helix domain-containing protein n=1 Tax=Streptomyces sp. NPDC094049 TaxID=3154987 RepID=UPI00331ED4FA
MAISVRSLLFREASGLRLVVGAAGVERTVTRVVDLRGGPSAAPLHEQPAPAAPPGALTLCGPERLPSDPPGQRAFVCAVASGAALVVEGDPATTVLPIALLAEAERHELPVMIQAQGGPQASERSRERGSSPPYAHACGTEGATGSHARTGDPVTDDPPVRARTVAENLASALGPGSEVALLDPELRPLPGTARPWSPALSAAIASLPSATRHDPLFRFRKEEARHGLTVRCVAVAGRTACVLVVLTRSSPDTARERALEEAVAELQAAHDEGRAPMPHELMMLRTGMRLLAGRELPAEAWRTMMAEFGLPVAGPYGLLVLAGDPAELTRAVEAAWGLGRWLVDAPTADGLLLVGRYEIFHDARAFVAGVAERLGRPVHAGLARADHRTEMGTCLEQARATARQARRRGLALITHEGLSWPELLGTALDPAGVRLVRAALREAFTVEEDGDTLLATLHAYVTNGARVDLTAEALEVHRHTVRARLRRCATLLGASMDSPDVGFGLWLLFAATARDLTDDRAD